MTSNGFEIPAVAAVTDPFLLNFQAFLRKPETRPQREVKREKQKE